MPREAVLTGIPLDSMADDQVAAKSPSIDRRRSGRRKIPSPLMGEG